MRSLQRLRTSLTRGLRSFILTALPTLPLLLLCSCQTIQIPNFEAYGSLGSQGAVGFYFLSTDQQLLSSSQWETLWENTSDPMVGIHASTLASFKALIEIFCSNENDCEWMTPAQGTQLTAMKSFLTKAQAISKPK